MRRLIPFLIVALLLTGGGYAWATGLKTQTGGKNLLADGDMEKSGTTDWTSFLGAVLTKENTAAEDGKSVLRVTYGGTGSPNAQQNIGLTTGKKYRVTGWARGDGVSTSPVFRCSPTNFFTGTSSNSWQRIDVVFTAPSPSIALLASGTGYAEFDDIVVTEYTGKTVTGGKQLLTNGDMEAGTTGWSPYQITRSSQSGAAEEGKLVMRVAYDGSHTNGCIYQGVTTVGNWYRITGWARGDGVSTSTPVVASKYVQSGQFGTQYWQGTTSTAWQHFDLVFNKQGNPNIQIGSANLSTGAYVEFDDVVLTDYTGKTITGGKQLLIDGDMEMASTSTWYAEASAILTKEIGGAQEGQRILRVTWNGSTGAKARQTILTVGKTYRVTGWARGDGSESYPQVTTLSDFVVWAGTTSTQWQRIETTYPVQYTGFRLRVNGTGYAEFDDVVVTQVD